MADGLKVPLKELTWHFVRNHVTDILTATEDEIIAFARARLAGFKTPKRVIFAELPKTSTGKIQKFELRAVAKLV